DFRAALGQRFHKFKMGAFHKPDKALAYRLVVERILDAVACRGLSIVERHFQIQRHDLLDLALPVIDADDGFDAQVLNEHDIHISRSPTPAAIPDPSAAPP